MSDLPPPPSSAQMALARMTKLSSFTQSAHAKLDPAVDDMEGIAEARSMRRANRRTAASVTYTTPRLHSPMSMWEADKQPFNVVDEVKGLPTLRAWCRAVYDTHPVVASAIDIYSQYPLVGAEIQVPKDSRIEDFYRELFFDDLNYEEYFVDVGREYWMVGEAWPLGTYNETLGIWEDDELMNPDDIRVIRSPFLREPRYRMRVPEVIRELVNKQDAEFAHELAILKQAYPELVQAATADPQGDRAFFEISNVLMRQLAFKTSAFRPRGVPIMLRAYRALMQEEMLCSAQDSIASRLYTPLILARLGASASDLGTDYPWIPDEDDLAAFEDSLDAALAADFRILIHHFAVDITSVFGREAMPNLDHDYERLTERTLQAFGMSKTMLSGGERGQTYAADALNRDLVTQLLTTYQRPLKRLFRDRARVVAEAHQHYDWTETHGRKKPIKEEVMVIGEDGKRRIEERYKLLIPEIHFRTMNMADDEQERMFLEALRSAGIPISMRTRLRNLPVKLDEETEATEEEQADMAVSAQKARRNTYERLKGEGLPIPEDLVADFGPKEDVDEGQGEQPVQDVDQTMASPADPTGPTEALVPSIEDPLENRDIVSRIPLPPKDRSRPIESDEQRADMPKAADLHPTEIRIASLSKGPRDPQAPPEAATDES